MASLSRMGRGLTDIKQVVIPARAGMDDTNHWILRRPVPDAALPPTSCRRAFAGMTDRELNRPSFARKQKVGQ